MSKKPPSITTAYFTADLEVLRAALLALPIGREVMAEPCDAYNALVAIGHRAVAEDLTHRPERGTMKWALRPATIVKFMEGVFAEGFVRSVGHYGAVYTRTAH